METITSRRRGIPKVGQVRLYEMVSTGSIFPSPENDRLYRAIDGSDVYELEALEPPDLQGIITDAIDAVIDVESFNAELDAERSDAAFLQAKRQQIVAALKGFGIGAGDERRTKGKPRQQP
jgi:hypothetical protein